MVKLSTIPFAQSLESVDDREENLCTDQLPADQQAHSDGAVQRDEPL